MPSDDVRTNSGPFYLGGGGGKLPTCPPAFAAQYMRPLSPPVADRRPQRRGVTIDLEIHSVVAESIIL